MKDNKKITARRFHRAVVFPPVAQLDNAADSDSEDRGFESLRAGQKYKAMP